MKARAAECLAACCACLLWGVIFAAVFLPGCAAMMHPERPGVAWVTR